MTREQRRARARRQTAGQHRPGRRGRLGELFGNLPLEPLAVVSGVLLLSVLIVYLIVQANAPTTEPAADRAAQDDSPDIPGTFVPSQGLSHMAGVFSVARTPMPFCDGVPHAGAPASAGASPTPTPTMTTSATATPSLAATPTPATCYGSNPPSSGPHLGSQQRADIGGGNLINIPPDPDVYPPDVEIPREAIPHILEHSGVFVGYNCPSDDVDCAAAVERVTDIVNKRIDDYNDRVVMARDSDLPTGEIGLASMARVDHFDHHELNADRVKRFISKNACRFDPEGFC